jgi:hypothetical protein
MGSSERRLGQLEPRERVGAQTSRKYEYQYERTARASLDLLADGLNHVCVYCDWHDDYVVETGNPPTRYVFHQVKARKTSQSPWSIYEFFGVRRKKSAKPSKSPVAVSSDAIIPLMLLHHKNFGKNCAGLAFVTNAGLEPVLSTFLAALHAAKTPADIQGEALHTFEHIARAYTTGTPPLVPPLVPSADDVFLWLRSLIVQTDQGHLESPDSALLELADVVLNYSEVELLQRQAKQISREIVALVRRRVGHTTTVVPADDQRLQTDKGIVVADLLGVLSLSAQAYEQLKAGTGQDIVKTLSRLERFCKKHGLEKYVVPICMFKAQWDIWRTIERHFLNGVDYVLLEGRVNSVLQARLSMDRVVAEAKDIAKQFHGLTATPLTPEHIMGLLFSMAAQSEAISHA